MNAGPSLVVDASVAVKWHLRDEELVSEASLLLEEFVAGRAQLAAPAFIRYEMAQSLERARGEGRISQEGASVALETFLGFGIQAREDSDALVISAQRIARATRTSVYDGLYVAQAEALGFEVITSDERLVRRAVVYPVPVHRLADIGDLL